jgi:hypothetical protein
MEPLDLLVASRKWMVRLRAVVGDKARLARLYLHYPRYPSQLVSCHVSHAAVQVMLMIIPGQLLRGATDDKGEQKAAALLVGIKLDLEAEVHLTARVKGDICVGLY